MQRWVLVEQGNFSSDGHNGPPLTIRSDGHGIAVSTHLDPKAPEHALMTEIHQGHQSASLANTAEVQHGGIERPTCSIQCGEPTDLPGVPCRRIGLGLRELRKHTGTQIGLVATDRAKCTHYSWPSQKSAIDSIWMVELIALKTIDDIQFPPQPIDEYAFSKLQYPFR